MRMFKPRPDISKVLPQPFKTCDLEPDPNRLEAFSASPLAVLTEETGFGYEDAGSVLVSHFTESTWDQCRVAKQLHELVLLVVCCRTCCP